MILACHCIRFRLTLNVFRIIEDAIAGKYYRFWTRQVIDKTAARERVAVKTMCLGAAFLMQHLVIIYDEEKKNVGKLFRGVSRELSADYDMLRERGVNPRFSEFFLKLAPEDDTRLGAMEAFEFLETVAPGLSILLRSDLLRIATMYPDHHIAPDSKFMDAQLLDTESRELIEKELECKQRTSGGADIETKYIELFEILFGADNGPWRARPLHGIYNFRQLQAINLGWYEDQAKSAGAQCTHNRSSSSWGSPNRWPFMHASSGPDSSLLPSTSSASSAFHSGMSEESQSDTYSLTPEHDGSQYPADGSERNML